ncbi:Zn-ribbon domain-containing OB-fold protein [Halorarius litoreus]|uniref:Zn-ribbon domain-containing OB-fold protein n=1 Tax=Halorarius litoreus TaxID=2962676 RepID=UPI0020CB7051|nr:OB-fold domain-containing protein [Halorarius litoreus]
MSETQELPETLDYATWARAVREGRLLGQECQDCGHVAGAPKGACAQCGSRDIETVELPTTGEVYTETTVNVPPIQFEDRGYQVALVQLGDARVMARIEGDHVDIGEAATLAGYVDEDEDHPAPVFERA